MSRVSAANLKKLQAAGEELLEISAAMKKLKARADELKEKVALYYKKTGTKLVGTVQVVEKSTAAKITNEDGVSLSDMDKVTLIKKLGKTYVKTTLDSTKIFTAAQVEDSKVAKCLEELGFEVTKGTSISVKHA